MSKILTTLIPKITANAESIENWFAKKFEQTPAIFYNSVDLRHSTFKIAPIDTNCFPAGFNNISNISFERAKKFAQDFLTKNFPSAKNILLIPENHTRNLRYLENISNLQEMLSTSQNHVVIGSMLEDLKEKTEISLENGKKIILNPLQKNGDKISTVDGFTADVIILNNDLTGGVPELLQNLQIPITPSIDLGWYQRTKSNHFSIYNQVTEEFAKLIDIDPWLISTMHRSCHEVNFKEQVGVECLARYVDELLTKLQEKYTQYGIKEKPYCYIKADNGTYGMAVMPVFSSEEVMELNKKERNKMNMLKESTQNTTAVIQEGIITADKINDKIAEPMIYLVNGQVVGNLFRVNDQRDALESLNATGATFYDLENLREEEINLGAEKKDASMIYSIIARLAALAVAQEKY